jgi:hypothetical protein
MSATDEPWQSPASKLGKEDDLDPMTMAAAKFPEPEDSRARYPSRPINSAVPSSIPSHRAEQLLKEWERRSKKQSPDTDTNDLIDADLLRSWDMRFAEAHGGSNGN